MRIKILTVLILLPLVFCGQDLKKVKNKLEKDTQEVFYVLKSDGKIKEGEYKLFERKKLKISGQYKANVKTGLWTEYGHSGIVISRGEYQSGSKEGEWLLYHENSQKQLLKAKGNYSSSQRAGVWEFYNRNEDMVQKFDFDKRELETLVPLDSLKSMPLVTSGDFEGLAHIDVFPEYDAGPQAMFEFLGKNVMYPTLAKESGISGTVFIELNISETGSIENVKIVRGIGGGCDEEVLRVFRLTDGRWNPGILEGQKVASRIFFPFRFVLV